MTPVVRLLIIANVIVYGLQRLMGDVITAHFALWPLGDYDWPEQNTVVGFHLWQLVTSAFLHGGVAHIVLNMYALFSFGGDVEQTLGSRRFAWLYGASVLTGSVVQLIVVTMQVSQGVVPTIGASGGVFGVLLAFGLLFPHRRVLLIIPPIPMPAWVLVTGYGLIELANGVFGTQQGVAHFAHLGGMLGAFVVLFAAWRHGVRPERDPRGGGR